MNYEEILEKVKAHYVSVSEFAFDEHGSIEGVGPFEEIDQVGGEGEGDHWHSVKHFTDHNVYVKVTGFYSSYNGTDFYGGWDCCSNVAPKEKVITVYE